MQEFVWYIQVSADMRLGQEQSAANTFSRVEKYIWDQEWRCTLFITPLLLL